MARYPIQRVRPLTHRYPPASNRLLQIIAALLGAAMLALLPACQPEAIDVETPVSRVIEKPVEVVVTRVVEKPVEVVVTRVVEKPVEVVVTRVVEKPAR